MVKVFALIPARTDVTEEYFHAHWAGPHAELAQRITTLRRYVQSHRIDRGISGLADSSYEGIAEVWFDDAATAAGMGEDPNYAEYAHLDEPNFIDTAHLAFVMSSENVIRSDGVVDKEAGGVKVMLLLRRADDVAPEKLAVPLGSRIAELLPNALRVTMAVALPQSYDDGAEPAFDAIAELRFADADEFRSGWDKARETLLEELDVVADRGRSRAFIAEEQRVIWPEDAHATA